MGGKAGRFSGGDLRSKLGSLVVVLIVLGAALLAVAAAAAADSSDVEGSAPLESPVASEPVGTELPSQRTATSDTYRLPNGALETQVFGTPINYKEGQSWKPIEEGLEWSPGEGITNGANSFDLQLPNRLGDGATRLSEGDQWVSSRLLGGNSQPAQLEAETASYEGAQPATTIELTGTATGVDEEIVLEGPSAPGTFHYELDASAGLTPNLAKDGSVEFLDPSGEVFAEIPPPSVSDASQALAPSEGPVEYSLEEMGSGNWRLNVEVDREWLASPNRSWPARIDPPLEAKNVVTEADCTIGSVPAPKGWTMCGTTSKELDVAYSQKENQPVRTFLNFAFTAAGIPQKSYVSEASMVLYAPAAAENTPALETRRVTKNWTTGLTWEQAEPPTEVPPHKFIYHNWTTPGGDFNSEGSSEVSTAKRGSKAGPWIFESESLRELVNGWVTHAIPDYGLMVKQTNETKTECEANPEHCNRRFVAFNSSSATSNKPHMVISYFPPAPSTSKVTSPTEGTRTARRLKLNAAWTVAGVTGITYQFREGKSEQFHTIPLELVRNAKNEPIAEWPIPTEGEHASKTLYFDAAHATPTLRSKGGPIQVRALFEATTTNNSGFSAPVEATVNRFIGGPKDATAEVGPGTVDLLTGNLSVSRTDVSIPVMGTALEFSRTFNSREVGNVGEKGVLGQGWKPGAAIEQAGGGAWRSVKKVSFTEEIEGEAVPFNYAIATTQEGAELSFEENEETHQYEAPPEVNGWSLKLEAEKTKFVLVEPGGTTTTFQNRESGSDYLPISIEEAGGLNGTRMAYEFVEGNQRLEAIIAPRTSSDTTPCTKSEVETHETCRGLIFSYRTSSELKFEGEYGSRLTKITYYAPGLGGPWAVAEYSYNTKGQLTEEWDPRILPALKEKYTYVAETSQIKTLTPPGQEPWTMEYGQIDEEQGHGRLMALSRSSLLENKSEATATTTIAYGVPVSGGVEGLSSMTGSEAAKWGQTDIPVDATAVFPPNQVPASPPTSYSKATVYYMDAEGYAVNTASPAGAGTSAPSISTSEVEEYGNVSRELTAKNRNAVLAASNETVRKELAEQLSTKWVYGDKGTQMEEEWGPRHIVRLASGESKEARLHKTVLYDEGAGSELPHPDPHLPTKEVIGASIQGRGEDADLHVTETRYNWTVLKPTETIVDPSGLDIDAKTVYAEKTGLPIETRQPSNAGGGGAGSTKILYYDAEHPGRGDPECTSGNPDYQNLPCRIEPSAQPGTSGQPELLVKKIRSYNALGEPKETVESPGGSSSNIRTTSIEYDKAGREISRRISGGGETVPEIEDLYNSESGLPTVQRFGCPYGKCEPGFDRQETTTEYDALGRPKVYKDADGNETKITYDLLGRPVTQSDNKGSQTITYDPNSGLPIKLEDSAAGTFTASYDADGNLIERGLPDGLTATTTYNKVDEPIKLSYVKASSCGGSCTWLEESLERSINGQILSNSGTLANEKYSYDNDGRLIEAQETPAGGTCKSRVYEYDSDSNRETLTTREGVLGGSCPSSGGTTQEYKYDAADRLLGTGLTYDSFGRITHLPTSYAGGKELTTEYFSTDMVAQQSQGGVTNSFELDASLRQRARLQAGGLEGTEVFHYDTGSDSPAWTERAGNWTRNIAGIGGELAATQDSGSGTTLQLTNLHGDVVATASPSPTESKLKSTSRFDEFGNPLSASSGRYGWLGGKQRRTELVSGVIQMGARSYVPSIGRLLTPDPMRGGSANPYDYANQDPINSFDLDGTCPKNRPNDPCGKGGKAASAKQIKRLALREARHAGFRPILLRHVGTITKEDIFDEVGNAISQKAGKIVERALTNFSFGSSYTGPNTGELVRGIVTGHTSPAQARQLVSCAEAASQAVEETAGWVQATEDLGAPLAYLYAGARCGVSFLVH